MTTDAKVILWGRTIGAVSWLGGRNYAVFQYAPDFIHSGIQIAPLMMPLSDSLFQYPSLSKETFKGLPGLLADSLPDKFWNAIIDTWLASHGKTTANFNPVERLCYVGSRGMGALEFQPTLLNQAKGTNDVNIDALVDLANRIMNQRAGLQGVFTGNDDQKAVQDILRVGTSAGGARAKAILLWNPTTNEFQSGQLGNQSGFEHWIMKFDGIISENDTEVNNPTGYGKIEYAYYLMAQDVGIRMMTSRLHHEGGRSHFMTKRFDRTENGQKLHMQSLGAMAHYDFRQPASYSYEQAIQVMKRLNLPQADIEQQVLRAVFNIVSRNCDDHVKNISFLMNKQGEWCLSPAYDVIYAWNPDGLWTSRHQMSMNGKRDGFDRGDLMAFIQSSGYKKQKADQILQSVINTVNRWLEFAENAGVSEDQSDKIHRTLRINI